VKTISLFSKRFSEIFVLTHLTLSKNENEWQKTEEVPILLCNIRIQAFSYANKSKYFKDKISPDVKGLYFENK
jgi:hypothetical protein